METIMELINKLIAALKDILSKIGIWEAVSGMINF